ncbi:MAG: HAMP domain-containing histidine kinase [Melioribacteraceae bacterium]|nr:HAMP domain-containing histidine kinase [Melioribacteraceae bacterium]
MKETKLKILISLMSAAVLSLIAIQFYWIANAIKLEEEKFKTNVTNALTEVTQLLDKEETTAVVVETISSKLNDSFAIKDEHDKHVLFVGSKPVKKITKRKIGSSEEINIEIKVHNKIIKDSIVDRKEKSEHQTIANYNFIELDDADSLIIKRTKLVENVVDQLITISTGDIKKRRVKEEALDSLLNATLAGKGITAPYEFTLSFDNDEHHENTCNNEHDLKWVGEEKNISYEASFRTRLFPNDFILNNDFLVVNFPSKTRYILKNLAIMLSLSALIIIGIIVLFYKTIQMLIKQKRITEIKNDLINNITHEFKTPISTISLACEALNEPLLLTKENSLKRYSGMINDENNRLRKLVENLLNTASIEKGDYNLKYEELDVHEMLYQSINKFESISDQKNGKIETEFNAEVKNINGDRFHLSNIFNNLIDNAIKYTKENPVILVSTLNVNKTLVISIKDNGIGISKQNLDKIFDTFYRVPTGNIHDVKGYGIGLSYVKKLTDAHNGKISVKSELNKGSEFIISLPMEI